MQLKMQNSRCLEYSLHPLNGDEASHHSRSSVRYLRCGQLWRFTICLDHTYLLGIGVVQSSLALCIWEGYASFV
jgi:hypothetical protein